MIFLRFLLLGFFLGMATFLVFGPGKGWLAKNLEDVAQKTQEFLPTKEEQVLGAEQETKPFQKKNTGLPAVIPAVLRPIEQASLNIQKTVEQIKKLPEDELETIKSQICNPQ